MARGGKREGAGRKSKSDEATLVAKLTPYDDVAMKALIDAVRDNQGWAIKLFMEYRHGKPTQTVNNNINTSNVNLKDVIGFDKSK